MPGIFSSLFEGDDDYDDWKDIDDIELLMIILNSSGKKKAVYTLDIVKPPKNTNYLHGYNYLWRPLKISRSLLTPINGKKHYW